MNRLQITALYDKGIANKERVQIAVHADTNLAFYVILDSAIGPQANTVIPGPRLSYWFQDHPVKAGDIVVLYTGTGPSSVEKRSDGGTNHFFHWNMPKTMWNTAASCAVLMELNNWMTKT